MRTNDPLRLVPELEEFAVLEHLMDQYAEVNGSPPFNLSHWDPGRLASSVLLERISLPQVDSIVPYVYSYDLDLLGRIVNKLGFSTANRRCLITPSGTSGINISLWWLKCAGIKELVILAPTYFPVVSACEVVDLKHSITYLRRVQGKWSIPQCQLGNVLEGATAPAAVWITNPVFSAGVYFDADDVQFLASLLQAGTFIIADECLALNGKELARKLGGEDRFLGIYSPHKSISINAIKFAALVFSDEHERFFEQWSDVLVGGLSSSNVCAMLHFLGNNFSVCHVALEEYISDVSTAVAKIIGNCNPEAEMDRTSSGHFRTCYFPKIEDTVAASPDFLRRLVFETGSAIIPGSRSHFDPAIGFNFRLNLARGGPDFLGALARTLRHLCCQSAG
jgi:hypothetical protein